MSAHCLLKCYFSERSTSGTPTGIRLNFTTKLEDLDFAEDFALNSSKYEHIQSKNKEITSKHKRIVLTINAAKAKIMKLNTTNREHEQV